MAAAIRLAFVFRTASMKGHPSAHRPAVPGEHAGRRQQQIAGQRCGVVCELLGIDGIGLQNAIVGDD